MKQTVSLKTYLVTLVVISIIALAGVGYVLSQSTGTFTISQGIYPGAPSYTIWKEGSTYYAKNAYGAIDYSGTDASTVIQNALNTFDGIVTSGKNGEIFFKRGFYDISTSLRVPSYVTLTGEGNGAVLRAVGPDVSVLHFNGINEPYNLTYNNIISNLKISGNYNSGTTGIRLDWAGYTAFKDVQITECKKAGISLNRTWHPYLVNVQIDKCTTGIYAYGDYPTEISMVDVRIQDCTTGIWLGKNSEGVFLCNVLVGLCSDIGIRIDRLTWGHFVNVASDSCKYPWVFTSNSSDNIIQGIQMVNCWAGTAQWAGTNYPAMIINETASGTIKDIMIDNLQIQPPFTIGVQVVGGVEGLQFIGGTISGGTDAGIYLSSSSIKNVTIIGLNVKNMAVRAISIVSGVSNVMIIACDLSGNGGTISGSDFIARNNIGYVTESSGTANFMSNTTTTFDHGLAGTPTGVWASFSSILVYGWTWVATSTQITITVVPSGSYVAYWSAEYKP